MPVTSESAGDRSAGAHRFARLVAVAGAASFLGFGLWAMVAPRSFFDNLATFDPYNQHFVQDIGAFQIGLGSVLLLAAMFEARGPVVVGLLGTGTGAAAHVVSHVVGRDLGGTPAFDIPVFAILAVLLLAAGALRWAAVPEPGHVAH